jgi:rhodanese-related sulfurtransferase
VARTTLAELLADARVRIERLRPAEAWAAAEAGAWIVDIRAVPEAVVPGSLLIPLTVLEWRLEPTNAWRSPHAPALADHVLLLCDHGESSSLAADRLRHMGFTRVGDVVGGFEAWTGAGLPVVPAPAATHGLPGMGPRIPL